MPPPPPPPRLHELCAGSMNTLARGACERVQSVQYIYTRGAVAVSAALYRERERGESAKLYRYGAVE